MELALSEERSLCCFIFTNHPSMFQEKKSHFIAFLALASRKAAVLPCYIQLSMKAGSADVGARKESPPKSLE